MFRLFVSHRLTIIVTTEIYGIKVCIFVEIVPRRLLTHSPLTGGSLPMHKHRCLPSLLSVKHEVYCMFSQSALDVQSLPFGAVTNIFPSPHLHCTFYVSHYNCVALRSDYIQTGPYLCFN